jgi:hypothetical protein
MRIWSPHPKYLDSKGIVALWRETLLAQKVLLGQTKGYRNHPQLERFVVCASPLGAVADYLHKVAVEATQRGYSFDHSKIVPDKFGEQLTVTTGQLAFERQHLAAKLEIRAPDYPLPPISVKALLPHPLFRVQSGSLENQERS